MIIKVKVSASARNTVFVDDSTPVKEVFTAASLEMGSGNVVVSLNASRLYDAELTQPISGAIRRIGIDPSADILLSAVVKTDNA